MLKRRSLVLLLVVLMLAVPAMAAAASVVFKDDALEEAVVAELKGLGEFTSVDEISKKDMQLLKNLGAEGVTNLSGLEYATKLKELTLTYDNKKLNLTPLRNLKLDQLIIKAAEDGKAFPASPDSAQMKILQEIQHRGAVVFHDGPIYRFSGENRYETAVRIFHNALFMTETNVGEGSAIDSDFAKNAIVLARGDDFADALAGASLAADKKAPILLTNSDRLHPATKKALLDYLDDYNENVTVYLLGGESAISKAVEKELERAVSRDIDFKKELTIKRIGGDNRYETAVKIAGALDETNGEVIVASGEDFADALSAAPYAAVNTMPILLTKKGELPECVEDYFKDGSIEKAIVAGGPEAVSADVVEDLLDLVEGEENNNGKNVTRVWGADRYATSVKLATMDEMNETAYVVATGEDFADALTGAICALSNDTGILLVRSNSVPTVVDDHLWKNRTKIDELVVLGGESAVNLKNAVTLYDLIK